MNFSAGSILTVAIILLKLLTVAVYAAVTLKDFEPLQDLSEMICPSQLCNSSSKIIINATRWCSCDPDCGKFRDCCYDNNVERSSIQNEQLLTPLQNDEINCSYIPSLGWSLIVSSCTKRTAESQNVTTRDRHLCRGKSEVQPHILDIPVTSATTGLTYKNVHCAVCNEDAGNLLPRRAVLRSNMLTNGAISLKGAFYEDGSLSWMQNTAKKSQHHSSNQFSEEGSGGWAGGESPEDDARKVAAVLRELHTITNVNTSGEDDLLVMRSNTLQDKGGSEVYGRRRESFEAEGNHTDAISELFLKLKTNSSSKGSWASLKDALTRNRVKTRNRGPFRVPKRFPDSTGEISTENPQNLSISPGAQTKFKLFLDSEFIRPCLNREITLESCDLSWSKRKDDGSEFCPDYSMPVYSGGRGTERKIFKNPHCAFCNNVKARDLRCLDVNNFEIEDENGDIVVIPKIDFVFGDVLAGHNNCGPRSLWDPLFQRCYHLEVKEEVQQSTTVPDPTPVVSITRAATELKQSDSSYENIGSDEVNYCEETTLMTMSKVQWYLASAFFGVSVVCLLLHVVVYVYPRVSVESEQTEAANVRHSAEHRQINGQSFIILSWLLLIGQLLFATGVRRSEVRPVCVAIAVLHNFLSLAAISWLSVFCLQVFKSYFSVRTFKSMGTHEFESEVPPLKLSLIAWIIPTLFSSLCLTLELVPGNLRPCLARGGACWYGETVSFRIFFVLPALLMLAGDGCIFTAIIFGIREKKDNDIATTIRGRSNSRPRRRSSSITNYHQRRFRLCARLGFIMAISWSCAAAASLGSLPSLWYGFVMFSGIQGIYIFVASGTKSRLTNLVWAKATGQSISMKRERSIRKNVDNVTNS